MYQSLVQINHKKEGGAMYVPKEQVNELLKNVDIVDIIRNYIPLNKKGNNYVGVCPFHDDHSPSLSVNPQRQIFKCFACGEGGNAIKFVQDYENISFPEAVKKTAELGGYHLDIREEERQVDPYKERMKKLFGEIRNYATYMIRTDDAANVRDYGQTMFGQGLLQEERFGYIDSSDNLKKYMLAKGYTSDELIRSGVFQFGRDGDIHSMFEGRLLFVLEDKYGTPVGYSGRSITNEGPKYLNSPETEFFHKREMLYNYRECISFAKKAKEVILVEGPKDAEKCRSEGIKNIVAGMGTALAHEQIQLLKKMNVPVKLCYDGDAAGIKATLKNYQELKREGVEVRTVYLPNGLDPAEMIDQEPSDFHELLKKNENIMDYYLKTYKEVYGFDERREYVMNGLKLLSGMENVLAEDFYMKQLSEKTGFDLESIKKQYGILDGKDMPKMKATQTAASRHYSKHSDGYVKFNFSVQQKMNCSDRVKVNFDMHRDDGKVTAFDGTSLLNRQDILKKYISVKGPALCATITLVNYDNLEYRAQAIANEAVKSIGNTIHVDMNNLDYVGYLHTHSKHPHIHLDIYQKEPYLSNYVLTSDVVREIEEKAKEVANDALSVSEGQEEFIAETVVKM
ncbi:DNA primase [Amedibacterium intestinale]|uniref:DNA primase n=1 Tax=Amedibacterium intestinale TaxID=2583452 RepID=A0A6N4TE62_9FIRM|nr:DNA primase [Amedibacterium intestinale]BBK21446.1 hypothetical protein Aargi30884_03490 [Amedibacterium intestinale]